MTTGATTEPPPSEPLVASVVTPSVPLGALGPALGVATADALLLGDVDSAMLTVLGLGSILGGRAVVFVVTVVGVGVAVVFVVTVVTVVVVVIVAVVVGSDRIEQSNQQTARQEG